MPHQLRRIIGINIRNPKEGVPSGRIVSMDPRGGVLAIGVNGVGKTTFLRLLPLFYGATVQQIMRGTGHAKMVAHVLPDPSSAVAFEYERESEEDLRTVVVHCRPNEDAPQFHILHGAYREQYFYDEHRQFVTRDEFKARVEAMGIEVSPKLFLHQYRSVILSENLSTKEGRELRRLAARHALGPRPLRHLDQIAAAMANEKISFRDLQSIVIDRVSDTEFGGGEVNQRTLKKNRSDVSRWIDDHKHLTAVMRHAPKAKEMAGGVAKLRDHHMALCSLHVAVKEARTQTGDELNEKERHRTALLSTFAADNAELSDRIAVLKNDVQKADSDHGSKQKDVDAANDKQAFFARIDIEALVTEEEAEQEILQDQRNARAELEPLDREAGNLSATLRERTATIVTTHLARVQEIDRQINDSVAQESEQRQEISEQRANALEGLQPSERAVQISAERLALVEDKGRLQALIHHPTEPDEVTESLQSARRGLQEAQVVLGAAEAARREQEKSLASARAAAEQALDKVAQVDRAIAANGVETAEVQQQLTPPRGSLLEFLRTTDEELWADGAKLLAPELLNRTDLNPRIGLAPIEPPQSGEVLLNSLVLDASGLGKPAWVDMAEVQARLRNLAEAARGLATAHKEASAVAKRAGTARAEAQQSLEHLQQQESLAKTATGNAQTALTRWEGHAQQQRDDCARRARIDLGKLQEKLADLGAEERALAQEAGRIVELLKADFTSQLQRLAADSKTARDALQAQRANAEIQRDEQITRIEADVALEAQGRGVDPVRMQKLRDRIKAAGERLDAIGNNRHHVRGWREFQRSVAPRMEAERIELASLQRRLDLARRQHNETAAQLGALEIKAKQVLADADRQIQSRKEEIDALDTLLAGRLKDFLSHVPKSLDIDWSIPSLATEVQKRLAALDRDLDELRKDVRTLRNAMTERAGPVADWLNMREKEHTDPQRLLEHQVCVEQAESVIEWFGVTAYGPYVDAMNKEMHSYFAIASTFVQELELFDRRINSFNTELQKALKETATFARFRDLSVTVRSGVGKINYLETLRAMRDTGNSRGSTLRSIASQDRELPRDEDVQLMRNFRDLLPEDGVFRVNLSDQVRLECSLIENGKARLITNEEEFRGISSNGNTALIVAMFLMGFVQMIRGPKSTVRVTWIADEVGRYDPDNLRAFLDTLDAHNIDVISASPSIDPEIARHFPRLCVFESNGSIQTSRTDITDFDLEEEEHATA